MEENKIKPAISETKNAMVETYAEDMAKILESDTGGLIKKIIRGEERHEAEKKNLSPQSKKNRFFMLVSILLVFLASVVLSFLFLKKTTNTVPIEKQFVPIIFNDQSTFLEVSGLKKDDIEHTVLNEINATKVKNGGLEGIYLTENKQIIGLRRFITLIKGSFIPGNNLFFVKDNFLLGVVNTETPPADGASKGFFILLKVRSAADIFDALRSWEEKMFFDLYGFLGIDISNETKYLLTKNFEDGIVENKNARLLSDKDGNLVVMYIFADDNSVIITNSPESAHEIMLRLASSQKKQ